MSNFKENNIQKDSEPQLTEVKITPSMQSAGAVSEKEKKIIKEYAYIIDAVASVITAKKKLPPSIDFQDLQSVGFDGLLRAIRGFDDKKETQFKTYANIRIRGAMLDLIRKEWRAKSSSTHDDFLDQIKARVSQVIDDTLQNGDQPLNVKNLLSITTTSYMVSLENVMEAYGDNVPDKSRSIDKTYELNDEYRSLNKIILELPKEDAKFIELFYRKGLSQKEISVLFDMSEATISRLHYKVISNLKSKLRNEFG